MNLIVQPRARAAFLITDTAALRADKSISEFRPKVVELRVNDGLWGALAVTGHMDAIYLRNAIRAAPPSDLKSLLAGLPDALRRAMDAHAARHPDAGASRSAAIAVALYDAAASDVRGFLMGSSPVMLPGAGLAPFVLHPVLKHLTEFGDRCPFHPRADITNPAQWSPERGGLRLIEAQRRDEFMRADGSIFYGIGGRAIVTRVDASGVTHRTLHNWLADREGSHIGPGERVGRPVRASIRHAFQHRRCRPVVV
jgi:hypothetical protein